MQGEGAAASLQFPPQSLGSRRAPRAAFLRCQLLPRLADEPGADVHGETLARATLLPHRGQGQPGTAEDGGLCPLGETRRGGWLRSGGGTGCSALP